MNRFLKTALPAALCAAMALSGCGTQTAAAPADASSPAASSAAPASSSPAADSAAAVWLDTHYDDETLARIYPNMIRTDD